MLNRFTFVALFLLCLCFYSHRANAKEPSYALIISYADFKHAEDIKILEDQIDFLESKYVKLLGVRSLKSFFQTGVGIAVSITFNRAQPDFIRKAYPILKKKDVPFTVFVALNDWKKPEDIAFLQELKKDNHVEVGLHTLHYEVNNDIKDFRHELIRSKALFKDILGFSPNIFSFTKGLYTTEMEKVSRGLQLDIITGQHTGAVTERNIDRVWPQFSVTPYKNFTVQGLDIILQTLPMEAGDIVPRETLVDTATPSVGFTIANAPENLSKKMKCFVSGKAKEENQFFLNHRVELRPKLEEGERYEIHCLLRDDTNNDGTTRWRRLGFLLQYQKQDEGAKPN